MEGWVSPGPGCKEQLSHSCYTTADSNPRPRGRWSSTLTTRPSRNTARSLPSVIEDRHAMSQSAFQGKVPKCPGSVKPASVATPHGESRHQVLVNYRMFIIVPTGRYCVVDDSRSRLQYRYYYYYHHAGKFSPLTHPRHEDYDVVKLNTPCPPAQATDQCIYLFIFAATILNLWGLKY